MPLPIAEIIRRSAQGMTRPFLCRCSDGHLYFVKGHSASRRSLICEWLAGHLARAFGLPIPEFTLASAIEELVTLHPEGSDLGTAPAFASRYVACTQELAVSRIADVPESQRLDVLAFDWWVHNSDRSLTALGGNPNLLWDMRTSHLVVIDHNAAFDPDFDTKAFRETHTFSSDLPRILDDRHVSSAYTARFEKALAVWQTALRAIPPAWWFADEERTVPISFDPDATLQLLKRYQHQGFWRFPT